MKKVIVILAILISLGVAGSLFWRSQGSPGNDSKLILYGNVDVRVVNLAFEASGRIADISVQEGDRVDVGQRVARLDDTRLKLSRNAARAKVDAQQAQLDELLAGSRKEQVEQLRAQLKAARIEADNAERNAVRLADLVKKQLASERDADDARTAADAARARASAAEASLRLAEAGSRDETIAAAKAVLEADREQLVLAQRNLDDAVLVAPQGGIVQNRILEPGDMATPERPVLTLAIDDPQWVRVFVSEADLGRVKPGLPAAIRSDSYPGRSYTAWVGSVSPSAEFTPKSVETPEIRTDLVYQTRVYLCHPTDELRQGMPVTVTIDTTAVVGQTTRCAPEMNGQ